MLAVAKESILFALDFDTEMRGDHEATDSLLLQPRASFVTLQRCGVLRGCIGCLEPIEALLDSIAHNAYKAAFEDHRFKPLTLGETEDLSIHISVLNNSEPVQFSSLDDLLQQLRPGVDGLTIRDGTRCGTFLPSVWEHLPEPLEFINQLKKKAGLPTSYWSKSLSIERYTVESFAQSPGHSF